MIYKEVIPAFDMLLEELERIIPELNAQGKDLLDQKQYAQARELISKAEGVVAFQGKVAGLREEWLKMQVPATKDPLTVPTPKPPKGKKTSRRTDLMRLESGLRTKNSDLFMPILRALVNNGGKLQFQKLLSVLENDLKDVLNEYDWQIMSDDKSVRWKNNVGWAKKHLSNAGYISNTAKRGLWEITELGREQVEESKKKHSSTSTAVSD